MVQLATAFTAFLATRSSATLTVAPGIVTPRSFSGARHEHLATRRGAGLFDFSFMCCIEVTGADSRNFLNALQTRAVDGLAHGRIAYTLLLRDDGSVLIDATLWHLGPDHYLLFVGRRGDFARIAGAARGSDVTLADRSRQHAVIALQGTASRSIIDCVFDKRQVPSLPYYGFTRLEFAGSDCWLARIGYSGETGYELVIPDAAAPALWEALRAAGAEYGLLECGFDAIDTLRIEAGHILFTHELTAPVTPAELGLSRLVDDQPGSRWSPAWRAQRSHAPARRLVGLLPASQASANTSIPAHIARGNAALTSSCWSPLLERNLGLGFVHADDAYPGTSVKLTDGSRARVARLPFYDPARVLPRRAP